LGSYSGIVRASAAAGRAIDPRPLASLAAAYG
jgi:hypothetical protein